MAEDLYAVLGVEPSSSTADIKRAYRQMARKYHPDKNPGDDSAAGIFANAAEAWRVLGDDELRAQYDRWGKSGPGTPSASPTNEAPTTQNVGEVFGDIFGRRGGGRSAGAPGAGGSGRPKRPPPAAPSAGTRPRQAPRAGRSGSAERGDDLRYTVELDFEDAAFGCERRISVPRSDRCPSCAGTGARAGSAPVLCQHCAGAGEVEVQAGFFTNRERCPECKGAGKMIAHSCRECGGVGVARVQSQLTVDVPAGVEDGTRLRLRGEGEVGSDGVRGDLYVVVKLKTHPFFKREGDDILTEIPIRFGEAALGATIEVPTMDGKVRMRVPPGSQSGRVFRLKGKGCTGADGRSRGDQRVKVVVEVPKFLTTEMRDLLERYTDLEEDYEENPVVRDYLRMLDDYYD